MSARVAYVDNVTERRGIAGQKTIVAEVRYAEDQGPVHIQFVGSDYGAPGPITMILEGGLQSFVDSPDRFGSGRFDSHWVIDFLTFG